MKILIRCFIGLLLFYSLSCWGAPVQGVEEIKEAVRNAQGHFERLGPWIIQYPDPVESWMTLRLEMNPKEAFMTDPTARPGEFRVRLINPSALMTSLGNLKEIGVSVYVGDNTGGQGTSQCEIYVIFMATGNYAPIDIERIYNTQRSAVHLDIAPPDRAQFVGFSREKAYFRRQVGDVTPVTITLKLYDSGYWYDYQASLAACAAPFFPAPPQTTPPQFPITLPPTQQPDLWHIASNDKRMILVPEGLFQSTYKSHEAIYLNPFYLSAPITHSEYARFLNEHWKKFKRLTDKEGHELISDHCSAIGRQKEENSNIVWTILGAPFRWVGRLFSGKPFIPFVVLQDRDKDKLVTHISWIGALAYCQFYDLALPTEYQWEKAVQTRTLQLIDINEWTNAWYAERVAIDFPLLNPQGPVDGTKKLYLRPLNPALFYREAAPADYHASDLGFRCVKNIN